MSLGLGAAIGIGAAGSAIGGLGSYFGAKYQADKSVDLWREQASYNTPAMQMQRFREAGLNPNLIYSQSESGNMSSPPQITGYDNAVKNGLVGGFQGLEMLLQLEKTKQEIETQKAQTENINADTESMRNRNFEYSVYGMAKAQAEYEALLNRKDLTFQQKQNLLASFEIMQRTIKHSDYYGANYPSNKLEG